MSRPDTLDLIAVVDDPNSPLVKQFLSRDVGTQTCLQATFITTQAIEARQRFNRRPVAPAPARLDFHYSEGRGHGGPPVNPPNRPGSFRRPFMNPSVIKGKRRITGVGAVFWRAPEMIHDKPYDEKVDIFSYGIVLCELIARVKADPDYLPRIDSTWGVDEEEYRLLVPEGCPEEFLAVTMQCCTVQSELRPSFSRIVEFLHILLEGGDASSQLSVMLRTLHSIDEDSDSQ